MNGAKLGTAALDVYHVYARARGVIGFTYLLHPNCVLVPPDAEPAELVFRYVHEMAHFSLANTTTGLVLQFIHGIGSTAEKILYSRIENFLYDYCALPARRQLILYGRPLEPGWSERVIVGHFRIDSARIWKATRSSPEFMSALKAFLHLRERASMLGGAWRLLHEGIATFDQLWIARHLDDARAAEKIKTAASLFGIEITGKLLTEIDALGQSETRRLAERPSSPNTQGFRAVFPKGDVLGSEPMHTWLPVLLASHTPYHVLDPINYSADTLQQMLQHGCFNFVERLKNAQRMEDEIDAVVRDESVRRKLIKENCPSVDADPLQPGWEIFSQWQLGAIADCDVMLSICPVRPSQCIGPDGRASMELFADDRRMEWRIFDLNPATVVFPDGTYAYPTGEANGAFERNFLASYCCNRTIHLIETLDTLFLSD